MARAGTRAGGGVATAVAPPPVASGQRRSTALFGTYFTRLAWVFLTACLVLRTVATGHGPFTNQYEFAVSLAWGMIAAYVYFEHRYHVRTISLLVLPIAAGMLLYALSVGATADPLVPALQNNPLLTIHVAVAIVAYGAFSVSFAAAVLYLTQPETGRPGWPKPALLGRDGLPHGHHRIPSADHDRRPWRSLGRNRLGQLLELGPEGDGLTADLAHLRCLSARQGGPRLGRTSRRLAAHRRIRLRAAHVLRQPLLRRTAQLREVARTTSWYRQNHRVRNTMSPLPTVPKPKTWQQRIRESRLGTLLVLALTAAIVVGGAYLVERPSASAAALTAIALSGPTDGAPPQIGSPAQDFTATTVDGKKVSLSGYKGHPVWLTFGASWCAACVAEAPDIQSTYEKFKASGVVVLAVFIREDSATVLDYANRVGLTYPKVADPDTRIASAYRVYGIPAHFFIDKTGILRSIKTGGLSPEQMAAAVTEVSR